MKNITIVLMTVGLLFNISCTETVSQKQPDKLAGACVVRGQIHLYDFVYDSTWGGEMLSGKFAKNHGGTLIQVIGQSASAVSDSSGRFTITGVDSGTCQFRFTHDGYDTLLSSTEMVNGSDTIDLRWHAADPAGKARTGDIYVLLQKSPTVTTESLYAAINRNYDSTVAANGQLIRIDTVYSFHGDALLSAGGNTYGVQKRLQVGFIYCISDSPTLLRSALPSDFPTGGYYSNAKGFVADDGTGLGYRYYNGDVTKRFYNISHGVTDSFINLREYVAKVLSGIDLSQEPRLYLHFIPCFAAPSKMWRDIGHGYVGGPYFVSSYDWYYGQIESKLIVWN